VSLVTAGESRAGVPGPELAALGHVETDKIEGAGKAMKQTEQTTLRGGKKKRRKGEEIPKKKCCPAEKPPGGTKQARLLHTRQLKARCTG